MNGDKNPQIQEMRKKKRENEKNKKTRQLTDGVTKLV